MAAAAGHRLRTIMGGFCAYAWVSAGCGVPPDIGRDAPRGPIGAASGAGGQTATVSGSTGIGPSGAGTGGASEDDCSAGPCTSWQGYLEGQGPPCPPHTCGWYCPDSKPVCDQVRFVGKNMSTTQKPYMLLNPSAAKCALQALRDGTQGQISWTVNDLPFPYRDHWVDIRPGRMGLHRVAAGFDIASKQSRWAAQLKDSTVYEGCIDSTEPDAVYDCLEQSGCFL
jgi:hypothetical protein